MKLGDAKDFRTTGAWLGSDAIETAVLDGEIVITPYSVEQLNPNSYNYTLSPRMRRLSNDVVDAYTPEVYEEFMIPAEGLILEPGECYLGSTTEVFGSSVYAALITGRSPVGRKFVNEPRHSGAC